MSIHHKENRRYIITMLRNDGTYFVIKNVKHIIYRNNYIEIFIGEHNIDRKRTWWPINLIDHVDIEEEN